MKTSQLVPQEYGSYYQAYIDLVGEEELLTALEKSGEKALAFLNAIPEDKMHTAYAEGKWSIKEIILHLIDSERIFAYRALRFARHDQTDLPGYEHDEYVERSNANSRSKADLLSEYKALRMCTLNLYRSFDESMLSFIGRANNNPMSARALGFIIVGHEIHHTRIITGRYL